MKRYLIALSALLLGLASQAVQARLNVLACEPEWGALVQELAGDSVALSVATTALQDPHHVQARPSLMAAVRKADLVVCTGAELEVGWLPLLLRQAGNPGVQPGQAGYFEASEGLTLLEIPARTDRADGDVHAAGNPHIQMDPRLILQVAARLSARLGQLDAANSSHYATRLSDFSQRWRAAMQRWEERARKLRDVPIVVHHKAFPYLENWLGLKQVAALQPKPGVEPSSGHLSGVLARLKNQPARIILRTPYDDPRGSEWLARQAGINAVMLPFTVGGTPAAKDLFSLFDDSITRLLAAAP